jgi:hypothetical protein
MNDNVISYRAAVAVAQGMLQKGLITESEYHQIDRVFQDKYCVKYGTLFLKNPLLFMRNRANMSQTKENGGGRNGEED